MSQVPQSNSEHQPVDPRWNRVLAGLRLTVGCAATAAILVYLALSLVACTIAGLCWLIMPLFGGEMPFEMALGLIVRGGVLVLVTSMGFEWCIALLRKHYYCAAPDSLLARALAALGFVGHLAVLPAAISVPWLNLGVLEGLTFAAESPFVLGCFIVAWIGLAADWGFSHALGRSLALDPRLAKIVEEQTGAAPEAAKLARVSIWKKDLIAGRGGFLFVFLCCVVFSLTAPNLAGIHARVVAIMRCAILVTLAFQIFSATDMEEVRMRVARLKGRAVTPDRREEPC